MTIEQFIASNRITMTTEWTDRNPCMDDTKHPMNHWKCVLRCRKRQMTIVFSMGMGLSGEPSAADVLDCLASDAPGSDQTFENWCSDYGYDTDSRKAERTFRAVQDQTRQLRKLLGNDEQAFNNLVYETERL